MDNSMSCYEQHHSKSSFLIQDCPKGYKCIIHSDDNGQFGTCELYNSFEYELSYPGGKCNTDEDCLSLKCNSNQCQGSNKGEKCQQTSDCHYGLQCFNNICSYPKPKGSLCKSHLQCDFPLLCYKGRCNALFTINNGEDMPIEDHYLCKSGRVYNGKCNTMTRINNECDDNTPCRYIDYDNKETILEGACSCPYENSLNSIKRCEMGNGNNTAWDNAIIILNKTMLPSNIKKCNLEENRPSFCKESLKTEWNIRRDKILLDKYIIEGRYGAALPLDNNNDNQIPKKNTHSSNTMKYKEMIMKTIFNYDNSPLIPKKGFKCPLFKTKHNLKMSNNTCVYSTNPLNENGDGIISYINPRPCDIGFECNHDESTIIPIELSYNSSCIPKPLWKSSYHLKMPGDHCDSYTQCQKGNYDDVGQCSDKDHKCTGHSYNISCISNIDCLNGLFCSDRNICDYQRDLNEQCRDVYDCKNKYGCMNNTCHEYFSLSTGAYLNASNPDASFCQFGIINEDTNQCIELKYYNGTPDTNGFMQCDKSHSSLSLEYCYYYTPDIIDQQTKKSKIIVKECQCGYNPFGKSYCPLSHDVNRSSWLKYFNKKKSVLDNHCHSLKRFDCNEKNTIEDVKYYKRMSINAHLFYEADNAIAKTLSSIYLYRKRGMIMKMVIAIGYVLLCL